MNEIVKAWALLVAASVATTAFAILHLSGTWAATALLALAMVKSRTILSAYLRLAEVPPIRRGFMAVLVIWSGVALALVFAAQS